MVCCLSLFSTSKNCQAEEFICQDAWVSNIYFESSAGHDGEAFPLWTSHLYYVIIRCVVNTYLRVLHVYAGASHINTITILIMSFGSGNMNPSNSYLISISSLIGILPNLETRTANKVNRTMPSCGSQSNRVTILHKFT